jgi:hypothetical protein
MQEEDVVRAGVAPLRPVGVAGLGPRDAKRRRQQ